MKLHLVRHPRPAVAAGLCYGASDVQADASALAHAVAVLRARGLPGSLPVYTSPLRRCAALAQQLDARSVHPDARLAEMDFGSWELRSWADIPRADVDAWNADLLDYRPGGAEHVLDVARRVAAFVHDLRRSGHAEAVVVCHAGTIRLLCALAAGGTVEEAALRAAATPHHVGYGDVVLLEI